MRSLSILALVATLSLSSCKNLTPAQQDAAIAKGEAAGIAALTTVASAAAAGQKVDSKVAAQAAIAALNAANATKAPTPAPAAP